MKSIVFVIFFVFLTKNQDLVISLDCGEPVDNCDDTGAEHFLEDLLH